MFSSIRILSLATFLLVAPIFAQAFDLAPEQINGIYELAAPERSAAGQVSKLEIEYGEINGVKMLATRGCERCPAAAYRYMAEESKAAGLPVFFNSFGIYILAKDQHTFVSVMGDAQLGKKSWKKISYLNVYSKQSSSKMTLEEGKSFAISVSERSLP